MPRSTLKVPAKARRCKGHNPTSFAAGRPALLKLRLAAEAITTVDNVVAHPRRSIEETASCWLSAQRSEARPNFF